MFSIVYNVLLYRQVKTYKNHLILVKWMAHQMQHTQINLESHTCSHTLLSPVNMNCTSTSTTVEHGHISKVVFLFCYMILIAQKIRITYLLTVTCFLVIFLSVNGQKISVMYKENSTELQSYTQRFHLLRYSECTRETVKSSGNIDL